MFQPNREALAWVAGFFDGEGSAHVGRTTNGYKNVPSSDRQYPTPVLQVSQAGTHPQELLERFQRAVGGLGAVNGPYKATRAGQSDFYKWTANGHRSVQAVVAMLWAFLGPVKRTQVKQMLTKYLAESPRRQSRIAVA